MYLSAYVDFSVFIEVKFRNNASLMLKGYKNKKKELKPKTGFNLFNRSVCCASALMRMPLRAGR